MRTGTQLPTIWMATPCIFRQHSTSPPAAGDAAPTPSAPPGRRPGPAKTLPQPPTRWIRANYDLPAMPCRRRTVAGRRKDTHHHALEPPWPDPHLPGRRARAALSPPRPCGNIGGVHRQIVRHAVLPVGRDGNLKAGREAGRAAWPTEPLRHLSPLRRGRRHHRRAAVRRPAPCQRQCARRAAVVAPHARRGEVRLRHECHHPAPAHG